VTTADVTDTPRGRPKSRAAQALATVTTRAAVAQVHIEFLMRLLPDTLTART
jgi:hypothetical protein